MAGRNSKYSRGLCFFTDPDGVTITLDAVTSYTYNLTAKATDYKIEKDGSSVADNVVNGKKKFTVKGVVTDMRDRQYASIKPSRMRESIELCMATSHTFNFTTDSFDFPVTRDCILTNASFERNKDNTYGYTVTLNIEQLRFTQQALQVETQIPNPSYKDPHAPTEDVGTTATTKTLEEKKVEVEERLRQQEIQAANPTGGS